MQGGTRGEAPQHTLTSGAAHDARSAHPCPAPQQVGTSRRTQHGAAAPRPRPHLCGGAGGTARGGARQMLCPRQPREPCSDYTMVCLAKLQSAAAAAAPAVLHLSPDAARLHAHHVPSGHFQRRRRRRRRRHHHGRRFFRVIALLAVSLTPLFMEQAYARHRSGQAQGLWRRPGQEHRGPFETDRFHGCACIRGPSMIYHAL